MFQPPDCPPVSPDAVAALAALLRGRRLAVLTGAGCSTESGIPDYRSPRQLGRVRTPIQHLDFVRSARTRARYWARSVLGWPRFRQFQPNPAHTALAQWNQVAGLITQNVDRLHHKAGSRDAIELHGALERVKCLACGLVTTRDGLQELLLQLNPGFVDVHLRELRPDGDAELPPEVDETFRVPDCGACGGVLKPDVVFFGDNVAPPIVEAAFRHVDEADALLVVGSSLAIHSGYRFVLRAKALDKPVAVVNAGPTRADGLATLKVDGLASDVLPQLAR